MDQTPVETVLDADVERRMLLAEVEALQGKATAEEIERVQSCESQLESIEADTAPQRAEELLINLGFSAELRSRKLGALSGGWRVRVALAAKSATFNPPARPKPKPKAKVTAPPEAVVEPSEDAVAQDEKELAEDAKTEDPSTLA